MTEIRVFISYSHDSPEHENRVLELFDRLREDGIDANIDQYQANPPEGWQLWMEKEIRDSQFVLLVCTETYLKRVMKEDEGGGKGVMWESTIIYSYLYDAGVVNEKFIPIVFGHENTKHIPTPLKPTTFYDVSNVVGYEALYRRLTNQPYTPKPELGKLKSLPPRERKPDFLGPKVSLAKLPSTDSTLFGRDESLKELDVAWKNPKINVVSLVAWGGVGKTALVNKWLLSLGEDFRGAERVYGWSFYSQGAREGAQNSADQFIAAALEWFGDPDPTAGSPWDKGERLAELIKTQRTLLILDGLEPLQNPPPVETGKIKDPGLTSLLRELGRQNPGLVLITTRLGVDDLKDFIGSTALEIDLETLSEGAGAAYLEFLGVDGTDDERVEVSHDFGGHALALTLLGRYLKVVHGGDIRKRKEIPHVMDEQKQGAHARRVMESYERWLVGKPELDILRLMGLFDRPAEKGALEALRTEPAIEGLTENIQKLSEADWKYAVDNLQELRLLARPSTALVAENTSHSAQDEELDCHPLLREHFGEKTKAENEEAWREGHNRLYEYYKASAKEYPETLEEMAPLYAAVMHGCQAGRHQEAFLEVYYKRILRAQEFYSSKKLGAMGSNLSALSGLFNPPWRKPVDGLSEDFKGFVFNEAGYYLRALGRLEEAAQSMRTSLEAYIAQNKIAYAGRIASNLSELYLTIGDVKSALTYAEQSVGLADKSGDWKVQVSSRTTLADALHQTGELAKSQTVFYDAEELQKKHQPSFPFLYSLQGSRYCNLLLSQGQYAEVERRASQMLEWTKQQRYGGSLYTIALDNLSLGRAYFRAQQTSEVSQALTYLNRAVDSLRQAGQQDKLPLGLLARAEYYRFTGDLEKAQRDLDEAFTIASRGGMGLYLADCHLEYARLALADRGPGTEDRRSKAREHLEVAKEMIEKMGYHRRDKEVEELEEQLK